MTHTNITASFAFGRGDKKRHIYTEGSRFPEGLYVIVRLPWLPDTYEWRFKKGERQLTVSTLRRCAVSALKTAGIL